MIGQLRNEILLRKPTATRNDSGHRVLTYGATDEVALAEAHVATGDEILRGEGMEAITQWVFRIRYPHRRELPGVTWRIDWEGTTYEIASVQDRDGRRRYLHLTCKEVAV